MRALARTIVWLTGLPLALLVALFAVANRQDVVLQLWPLPWSLTLPVYLAVLGALALGLMLGGGAMALSVVAVSRRAGQEKRRAESLARQLAAAQVVSPESPS